MEEKNAGVKALRFPLFCAAVMWILYFLHTNLEIDLTAFGIIPRNLKGITGIFTGPFVHHDFNHLTSNTLPLLVVGTGLFFFYKKIAFYVLMMITMLNGIWVWLFARSSAHIGASGVIYGLVCFLFFSGLIRGDRRLMAISLLVTFLYGSMVWGILPVDLSVSWESHLFGSVAGIFAAIYYRKQGPQREKYLWELEEEQEKAMISSQSDTLNEEGNMTIHYIYKEEDTSKQNDKL
jgi:membrane associated rhomboid family serine protease